MAAPLSILISDPNGCLTFQIFELTVVSGQACKKPGMKSCGVCDLGCSAFRGSDRFTVTKSVQKGRGTCLSRRDLPVISALVAIRQTQVGKRTFQTDVPRGNPHRQAPHKYGYRRRCSCTSNVSSMRYISSLQELLCLIQVDAAGTQIA